MNEEEFVKQLNEAHQLMKDEKFKESIIILEKLKDVEKKGEYGYGMTHKLYQLISNAHSLYHQQEIQKFMGELLLQQKTITFSELNQLLKERMDLDLDVSIFRKELELLILRGLIACNIEGDRIIF